MTERWGGGTATGAGAGGGGRRARARSLIKAAAARGQITLPYLYPVAPQLSRLPARAAGLARAFVLGRPSTRGPTILRFLALSCGDGRLGVSSSATFFVPFPAFLSIALVLGDPRNSRRVKRIRRENLGFASCTCELHTSRSARRCV